MKNTGAIILLLCLLTGCKNPDCTLTKTGKVKFVGYKVAKSSHMCFELIENKTNHQSGLMGGRREPNIPLGTIIQCQYQVDTCNGGITLLLDAHQFAKEPTNRDSRIVGIYPF